MDYSRLASELVRSLRAARSQLALSRHLGYQSNVVRTWEAGRRFPKASVLIRLCERSRIDPRSLLDALYRDPPPALVEGIGTDPMFISLLLDDLRGGTSIRTICEKTGVNRYTISRWLSGVAEPNVPDFLRMADSMSPRLLDLVAAMADPGLLPSVAEHWKRLCVSRRIAVEYPWSHAVLRALELEEYRAMRQHVPGFIADRLGISIEEENRCIALLAEAGQIVKRDGLWEEDDVLAIDTRSTGENSRALRLWWTKVGADHIDKGRPGLFSYNLFTVSDAGLQKLKALHLSYFRELRAVVAESEPAHHVMVANVQLFELGGGERSSF